METFIYWVAKLIEIMAYLGSVMITGAIVWMLVRIGLTVARGQRPTWDSFVYWTVFVLVLGAAFRYVPSFIMGSIADGLTNSQAEQKALIESVRGSLTENFPEFEGAALPTAVPAVQIVGEPTAVIVDVVPTAPPVASSGQTDTAVETQPTPTPLIVIQQVTVTPAPAKPTEPLIDLSTWNALTPVPTPTPKS